MAGHERSRHPVPAACAQAVGVYAELVASLRFKPTSGRDDWAAGIFLSLQDRDNYYILRANALENNMNLYVFAGGDDSASLKS